MMTHKNRTLTFAIALLVSLTHAFHFQVTDKNGKDHPFDFSNQGLYTLQLRATREDKKYLNGDSVIDRYNIDSLRLANQSKKDSITYGRILLYSAANLADNSIPKRDSIVEQIRSNKNIELAAIKIQLGALERKNRSVYITVGFALPAIAGLLYVSNYGNTKKECGLTYCDEVSKPTNFEKKISLFSAALLVESIGFGVISYFMQTNGEKEGWRLYQNEIRATNVSTKVSLILDEHRRLGVGVARNL